MYQNAVDKAVMASKNAPRIQFCWEDKKMRRVGAAGEDDGLFRSGGPL